MVAAVCVFSMHAGAKLGKAGASSTAMAAFPAQRGGSVVVCAGLRWNLVVWFCTVCRAFTESFVHCTQSDCRLPLLPSHSSMLVPVPWVAPQTDRAIRARNTAAVGC
jgi:hypothetical protein